jgi:hypothetical protein
MVPDSSVFAARKPIKMIYSYNKLSVSNLKYHSGVLKHETRI